MTATTHFLRFADEAEAIAAMPWARGLDDAGAACWMTSGPGFALDAIGLLQEEGLYDAEARTWLIAPTALPGWHANLRIAPALSALIPAWAAVTPATPARDFA